MPTSSSCPFASWPELPPPQHLVCPSAPITHVFFPAALTSIAALSTSSGTGVGCDAVSVPPLCSTLFRPQQATRSSAPIMHECRWPPTTRLAPTVFGSACAEQNPELHVAASSPASKLLSRPQHQIEPSA